MLPKIGITCDFETITCRRGQAIPRYVLNQSYVQAVVQAGGVPWLLPHAGCAPRAVFEHLDGLVISGGDFDVPPSFYAATTRPGCGRTLPERSAFEAELCRLALAADLPLLGICGGMQLLCVVLGGSLYQDLAERPETMQHQQSVVTSQPSHAVALTPGSLAQRCLGEPRIMVNSTHHQIVQHLGSVVQASGEAPDGAIEAIEVPGKRFALGLQWHPERLGTAGPEHAHHLGPYQALVAAASGNPT